MAWLPSHRKEVLESRGWRGKWRRQEEGWKVGSEDGESFGDAEKQGRGMGGEVD